MTGILEIFLLLKLGSEIGFLVAWRNRRLASKVNHFHSPHNRKSPIDKLVRAQTGPAISWLIEYVAMTKPTTMSVRVITRLAPQQSVLYDQGTASAPRSSIR